MGDTELSFRFDERRSVQACALLLAAAGGRSNYTRILKLLYLADRQSLQSTGQPITGSRFVNMANGPVLSEVYECIRDDRDAGYWDRHIVTEGYDIRLIESPGDDELSDFDVNVLSELAARYAAASYSRMIDIVHGLPEWKHPSPAKVASLPASDVLRALGEDDEVIAGHARAAAHVVAMKKLLTSS